MRLNATALLSRVLSIQRRGFPSAVISCLSSVSFVRQKKNTRAGGSLRGRDETGVWSRCRLLGGFRRRAALIAWRRRVRNSPGENANLYPTPALMGADRVFARPFYTGRCAAGLNNNMRLTTAN